MSSTFSAYHLYPTATSNGKLCLTPISISSTRIHYKKVTKNRRNPRRTKLPPDFGVNLFLKKPETENKPSHFKSDDFDEDEGLDEEEDNYDVVWEKEEIEAISSMFHGRIPQKPGVLHRERPLPLPLPHKLRPLKPPTPKKHVRLVSPELTSSRASVCTKVYKSPSFLINLAREIKLLDSNENVCVILDKCARFLRKGSLSLTVRELGQMGLPDRALQTFCWVQKQPQLFPDDRILASTVEVLARHHELKLPPDLDKFIDLSSRGVLEAMVKGFIKGQRLKLAWKVISVAKQRNRTLDASVYVKLVLELVKNPDRVVLVENVLDELAQREDLNLSQQDCTAIMKVGVRVGRFEIVESLFNWFRESGHEPSVVMYTTLIYSRYEAKRYREALAVVWDMEAAECLFDLPAYRVVIRLFVALNDLSRAARYFSKLKEAGFSPTYDIYRDMIRIYMASERLAKCKELCREVELTGFKLDKQTREELTHMLR